MRASSAILDLECKAPEALQHGGVERVLVLGRGLLVERGREVVAQPREDFGTGLDEVDVVAVALLGLVARSAVVRALGRDAVVDQAALVAFEQIELPFDNVREACSPDSHASTVVRLLVRTW